MALALRSGGAGSGRTWPNPAVGAVVVKDGVIVGRGWTQPGGRPHAETAGARAAPAPPPAGRRCMSTLEPCSHHGKTPPCADAIIARGIARVVSALVDPNPEVAGAGHWRMADAGVVVEVGLGADEARRAHAGHIRRVQDGRPHVMLKLAVSADEKVGLAGRRPTPITGEAAAERRFICMRAMNDARAHRHRHRAGGRPAAHLPPAGHALAGARRARQHAAASACRQAGRELRAQTPLWVVTAEGAPREHAAGARGAWRRGAARGHGPAAGSILRRCSSSWPNAGSRG